MLGEGFHFLQWRSHKNIALTQPTTFPPTLRQLTLIKFSRSHRIRQDSRWKTPQEEKYHWDWEGDDEGNRGLKLSLKLLFYKCMKINKFQTIKNFKSLLLRKCWFRSIPKTTSKKLLVEESNLLDQDLKSFYDTIMQSIYRWGRSCQKTPEAPNRKKPPLTK